MSLPVAFQAQADICIRLGSPFMGRLLGVLSENWPSETALDRKCARFEGDIGPAGHSLPLRIAAGLHALVLTNAAPALAVLYPPHQVSDAALRDGILSALRTHERFLLDWIDSPPQTNEVRRSAALIAGAHVALQHFDLLIHLSELGASAGLNLMWDHYAIEIAGKRFGSNMPAVLLRPDWTGEMPPNARPVITHRAGVDLNPLDPAQHDHLLRLTAYLWADQPERLTMTRAAAAIATTRPQKGDAIDWLGPRLSSAPQGSLHLIQHTVVWQYLSPSAQATGRAMIEAAGRRATRNRPLAWLSMEADGDGPGAALVLRLWPGELTLDLGRADFHGRWINWTYKA